MKSVLISINSNWVELIASGIKKIEMRKSAPATAEAFKGYIYCTKDKTGYGARCYGVHFYENENGPHFIRGKRHKGFLAGYVVGEFICNKVDTISHFGTGHNDIRLKLDNGNYPPIDLTGEYLDACQLSIDQLEQYSKGKPLRGWHITDLVMYDTPIEITHFKKHNYGCEMFLGGDKTDCYNCKMSDNCFVQKAPQSWCYVEELQDSVK